MAQPTIYIIHASDAPQHLGELKTILQNIKTENRIVDFVTININPEGQLSSLQNQIRDKDFVLALLTHEFEPYKKEIEDILTALNTQQPEIGTVEIIVDNVSYNYNTEFMIWPSDFRPIRGREDMDATWNDIEQSLKDTFPVPELEPAPKAVNWSKHLKIIGFGSLLFVGFFVLYGLFSNNPDKETAIVSVAETNDPSITDSSEQPAPYFPSGSSRVYSADFSQWHTKDSEYGSVKLGFGNSYVLQPSSNTWIGSGPSNRITTLEGDFVFDVRFRMKNRNPSSSLSFDLIGGGTDANFVTVFFTVWNDGNVVYSLNKGRIRSGGSLPIPHKITEERIAERVPLSPALKDHDWSQGSKLTLKREGTHMQFFVNDTFVKEFNISQFSVMKTSVIAAYQSKVILTSIEARTRN